MNEPENVPDEITESDFPTGLRESRAAILFVASIFGIIAGLSFVGFIYNLTIHYPGTSRPVIVVDPLWMVGHVIRGLGLGLLTYRMCRYQAVLKHWCGPDGRGTKEFALAHSTVWKTGALVLGVLLGYSVVYVAQGGPRL